MVLYLTFDRFVVAPLVTPFSINDLESHNKLTTKCKQTVFRVFLSFLLQLHCLYPDQFNPKLYGTTMCDQPKKPYVSVIKINGVPILPPLVSLFLSV